MMAKHFGNHQAFVGMAKNITRPVRLLTAQESTRGLGQWIFFSLVKSIEVV